MYQKYATLELYVARARTVEKTRQQRYHDNQKQIFKTNKRSTARVNTTSSLQILLYSRITQQEKMSKNLLARVKELQDAMASCQKSTANLIEEYQLSVIQTAAVVASVKIKEEKAQIEKKKELLRKQIEKEKESSRIAVDTVYQRAKQSIESLIHDKNDELQGALDRMRRQHKAEIARVRKQTREKTIREFTAARKRKMAALEPEESRRKEKVNKVEGSATWKCANCGKLSTIMLMCSGCHGITYCDEICQERDWCKHEDHCTKSEKAD